MTEELLVKYISGQANQDETEAVLGWAKVSEERDRKLSALKISG